MRAISAEIMSEIDRKAQEYYGLAQVVLMENAGRAVAGTIINESLPFKDQRVAIFCGKGNNGGDGFVVARYLANESPERLTVYVPDAESIKPGASCANFEIIRKMGLDIRPVKDFQRSAEAPEEFTIAVDSIFGTGFHGELPEDYAAVGRRLNASGARVYAVDVPSGLDATTGAASKDCFRAHKTITFGLAKQGFFVKDGPGVCGEVVVRNIGFPLALLEAYMGEDSSEWHNCM